jgi:hypothetical protein
MPEISVSQSQKEVTANETFRVVDALCQCTVIDKDLSDAPGSPSDGDTYIVGPSPSSGDDWDGETDHIAYYSSSYWVFHVPEEGWRVWVQDEDEAYVYASASAGWIKETELLVGEFIDLADAPSSYSGQDLKLVRVNSGATALEFADNKYDIGGSYNGKPPASYVLLRFVAARAIDYADDFAGSQGYVDTAPAATKSFLIKVNGVQVGTMQFALGANTATFTTSSGALQLAAGERLTVEAPASQDATLADLFFTLKGSMA